MKKIDIKGKEYVQVNERIKYFIENFEGHYFLTEIVSNENDSVIMICKVYDTTDRLIATGHAYEEKGSSFINKTSHLENCETSAIGRALGMLGIGIDTSLASFEEVANAVINQEKDEKPWMNEKEKYNVINLINDNNIDEAREYCKKFKISKSTNQELKEAFEFQTNLNK